MLKTITREELKEKMGRGDDFVLFDTLGAEYYEESRPEATLTSGTTRKASAAG